MDKQEILDIANEAYPKIVKYFGKGKQSTPEIVVYRNVFVDLTGDEDAEGEDEPSGRYDGDVNKYLYIMIIFQIKKNYLEH